jgi:hypothetical protein
MNGARELLEIAAEFVEARSKADWPQFVSAPDLDEIAGRWERALDAYVRGGTD